VRDDLHDPITAWYAANARDLPWRRPGTSAWSVTVSEFMLQQTPVSRVLPVHEIWMTTWPTPADLAAAPSGDAVRAWGRLGYPRRALRLHASAVAITERFDGEVPDTYDELRTLPGIGDYTAAAIASFAFGRSHAVLDTNVRRVLGRAVSGVEFPGPSVTAVERALAETLVPEHDPEVWAVAVMELGALVCTAANPACEHCPVLAQCAWHEGGKPAYDGPPRKVQTYAGTDRMCRGRLLAVLRDAHGSVTREQLDAAWVDDVQRARALASLIADGLVVRAGDRYALPG
jgi:A/G-specific adenine glycosylase